MALCYRSSFDQGTSGVARQLDDSTDALLSIAVPKLDYRGVRERPQHHLRLRTHSRTTPDQRLVLVVDDRHEVAVYSIQAIEVFDGRL